MKKIDEVTIIDIQLFATILSIVSFAFTFILLYNQKLLEQKKEPLFSKKKTLEYVAYNRLFILLIVLLFLGANALHLKLDKEKNKDLKFDYLDILSSVLTLIVALLSVSVSFTAVEKGNLDIDLSVDEALS